MPDNRIEITADGSHSVFSSQFEALYHSKHGAIQESEHVFIDSGLKYLNLNPISILEMGFGTGLNALLALIHSKEQGRKIYYETVEAYPLGIKEVKMLNYTAELDKEDYQQEFLEMHTGDWEKEIELSDITLVKRKSKLENTHFTQSFDLVFYDAFAPLTQEELWTADIFQHIAQFLNPGAVLVSYCAKGSFKRALISAGFSIEKIPGPPGKREMIRATFRT